MKANIFDWLIHLSKYPSKISLTDVCDIVYGAVCDRTVSYFIVLLDTFSCRTQCIMYILVNTKILYFIGLFRLLRIISQWNLMIFFKYLSQSATWKFISNFTMWRMNKNTFFNFSSKDAYSFHLCYLKDLHPWTDKICT